MLELSLSKRVLTMKPSATLGMAQAARELAAKGVDVKVLSAGEPDAKTAEVICAVAKKAIDDGKVHYVPVPGTKNMVTAMQEKFLRDQGVSYEADQVMCTVGAKSALLMALDSVINDGDEIIIFAPYWVSYAEQVRLSGGVPVVVSCTAENNFMPTKEDLAKAISTKTKALMLNSPNNPSGGVISLEQLHGIAEVLKGTGIWVISDEIYEKLLFDGHKHYSPAALSEDMKERTIVISGASKGYAMTGWRVGFVAGSKKIIGAMVKLQGQQTTCLPEFIQDAAAFALRENDDVKKAMDGMLKSYKDRRDAGLKRIAAMPLLKAFKPQGAFYLWVDFSEAIKKKGLKDDVELATLLLKEAHVATVPGGPFGSPGFIRMSIASAMDEILEALDRIDAWLKH